MNVTDSFGGRLGLDWNLLLQLLANYLPCFLIVFRGLHEEGRLIRCCEAMVFWLTLDRNALPRGFEGKTYLFAFAFLKLHSCFFTYLYHFRHLRLWFRIKDCLVFL